MKYFNYIVAVIAISFPHMIDIEVAKANGLPEVEVEVPLCVEDPSAYVVQIIENCGPILEPPGGCEAYALRRQEECAAEWNEQNGN